MSDLHALSGAYAVDALEELERVQFERHLTQCDGCRDEVEGLLETASLISEVAAIEAPSRMRSAVLAEIATVRPLPPQVVAISRHRTLPRLLSAAAAVVLIGAGAAGLHAWDESRLAPVNSASAVLKADDHQRVPATLHGAAYQGASVQVTRSSSLNAAVVDATGLPALPADKIYELWLTHGSTTVPAGVLESGETVLSGDPASADAFAITVEPAGGSTKPTTRQIASAPL